MDDIINRILTEMKKRKISQAALCRKLDVQNTVFTDWKSNRTASYKKYLPKIAEILNCSVEYLTTGQETPAEAWYRKYLMQDQKVRDAIDVLLRD